MAQEGHLAELAKLAARSAGPAQRVPARSPLLFFLSCPNGSPVVAGSNAVVHAYLTGYQAGHDRHRNDFT